MDDIFIGILTVVFWISTVAFLRGLTESKHQKLMTFLYFAYAIIYTFLTYFTGANHGK